MNSQNIFFMGLIITNLLACFGVAIPLSVMLKKTILTENRLKRYFTMFVGIYFIECIAFTSGMCTQVFTFGLAVIWGIIFGMWWNGLAQKRNAIDTAIWFSLYTCAPTVSFSLCLIIMWVYDGKDLLNVIGAKNFGIPQFVPWPFNTLLGFCAGLAVVTLFVKTFITTFLVKLIVKNPPQIIECPG